MIKKSLTFLLLLMATLASAQDTAAPQMADDFRANGKIYVVITVIALIFAAIVLFLVFIERRLKSLENKTQDLKADN